MVNVFVAPLRFASSHARNTLKYFEKRSRFCTLNVNINDTDNLEESDRKYEALVNRYIGSSKDHNCLIIHPYVKWGPQKLRKTNPTQQIEEAAALIKTLAPWRVHDTLAIPLDNLVKKALFGSGTLEMLRKKITRDLSITAVFINVESLANIQLTMFERMFGVTIFDRYRIVMQILRLHATSKHAKLQVALAEIPYMKKHLNSSDLISSGILKTRNFLIQQREQKLLSAIKKLRSQRELLRKKRKQIDYPVIAIVGYTNAGKTSLIKALTGDRKLQPRDIFFATLDVTVHAGILPSNLKVLYVDTVGFISNIPTSLIECFVSTLEDAMSADIILLVEDLSSKDLLFQRQHVMNTLNNLSAQVGVKDLSSKIIRVGSKCDLAASCEEDPNILPVSSTTGFGIETLMQKLETCILAVTGRTIKNIRVPAGGEESRWLYKHSTVSSVSVDLNNSQYENIQVIMSTAKFNQFIHHFK